MKKIIYILSIILFFSVYIIPCFCADNMDILNLEDLANKKIGVGTGTANETWAYRNLIKSKIYSFPSGIEAAMDVKAGNIDCAIFEELTAKAVIRTNPQLKIVYMPYFAEHKEMYAMGIKKGNAEIQNLINETITELKENGIYQKLIESYMPENGEVKIHNFKSSPSNNKLRLGTTVTIPPFAYLDGRKYVGFDLAVSEYIAAKANKQLEIVNMQFQSLIPALKAGKVDFIASGLSVTDGRKKNIDFSIPYYSTQKVLIMKK